MFRDITTQKDFTERNVRTAYPIKAAHNNVVVVRDMERFLAFVILI